MSVKSFFTRDEYAEDVKRAFFDSSPHATVLVDKDGQILAANDATCRLLGYSVGELMSMSWMAITHPSDIDSDMKSMEACLDGQIISYTLVKRYRHKLGHWIPATLTVFRIPAEGAFNLFVSHIVPVMDYSAVKVEKTKDGVIKMRPKYDLNDILKDNAGKILTAIIVIVIALVMTGMGPRLLDILEAYLNNAK